MRNLRLTIEYDGSDFYGFQRQSKHRSIQGELEKRLSTLFNEQITVVGAGRTDAGVHATGQVVNFNLNAALPIENAVLVFNGVLPHDIAVRKVEEVDLDFHARRMARSRTYRYTILNQPVRSARLGRFTGWVPQALSIPSMQEALQPLLGEHDFRAFQAAGSPTKTTYRRMIKSECRQLGDLVWIILEADAFLYQMARIIIGAVIQVGTGQKPPEWVGELMRGRDRRLCPPPAPASGLCLIRVRYT